MVVILRNIRVMQYVVNYLVPSSDAMWNVLLNKMKNKKYYTVGTSSKSNQKLQKEETQFAFGLSGVCVD
jgi:hypothetical protein